MKIFKCLAVLCLTCLCVLPSLAHANKRILVLENDTSQPVHAAVRYFTSNVWYTKGWYVVHPGQSQRLDFHTTNQYMYVYGKGNHGEWTGEQDDSNDSWLFVVDQPFSVTGNGTPGGSGRKKVLFDMLDFEHYTEYVYTFSN